MGLPYQEHRLIGGGSRSRLWSQIVSDVLGQELFIPVEQDAAYGAGLLTAVAAGMIPLTAESIQPLIRVEQRVQPDPATHARYNELFAIYELAEQRLHDVSHRLTIFESNGPQGSN